MIQSLFGTPQNTAILFERGKEVCYDFSCSPMSCSRAFHCSRNKMIFGRSADAVGQHRVPQQATSGNRWKGWGTAHYAGRPGTGQVPLAWRAHFSAMPWCAVFRERGGKPGTECPYREERPVHGAARDGNRQKGLARLGRWRGSRRMAARGVGPTACAVGVRGNAQRARGTDLGRHVPRTVVEVGGAGFLVLAVGA